MSKHVLEDALALIEHYEQWAFFTDAKDEDGNMIGALDSRAVCFCATGAIRRAAYSRGEPPNEAMEKLARVIRDQYPRAFQKGDLDAVRVIQAFNDWAPTNHSHVIDVFQKAIST